MLVLLDAENRDPIFIRLHKTAERDGQKDRQTEKQPALLQRSALRGMRTCCKKCYCCTLLALYGNIYSVNLQHTYQTLVLPVYNISTPYVL